MGEPIDLEHPQGPSGPPCIAVVNATRLGEAFGTYAVAFIEAGRVLFRNAVDGRMALDTAFVPAAYNVRHGVELLIKQLALHHAYELRDRTLVPKYEHGLRGLWLRLRKDVAPQSEPEVSAAHIAEVDDTVRVFEQLDAKGTALRYPVGLLSTTVPKSSLDPHAHVDLREWLDRSARLIDAAVALLWAAQNRTDQLRIERGHDPIPLADLLQEPWVTWTLGG